MKFLVAILVFCYSFIPANAQDREIQFEKSSLKEAILLARNTKKLIFIDCYTSWCGPCKALAKDVFTNNEVADFFNSNFINLKLDCEKEGKEVARQYHVISYPTLLFIDVQGNLIHRISGYMNPQQLLSEINEGLNPETSLVAKKKKFESGTKEMDFLVKYFHELNRLSYYDDTEAVAKRILSLITKEDFFTVEMWPIVSYYSLSRYGSEGWNFLMDNSERFISIVGKSKFSTKFHETMYSHLFRLIMGNGIEKPTDDDFKNYLSLIEKYDYEDKSTLLSFLKMAKSRTTDSFNNFFKTFVTEIYQIAPTEHNRLLTNTLNYLSANASKSQKKRLHKLIDDSKAKQNEYMAKFFDDFHTKIENVK